MAFASALAALAVACTAAPRFEPPKEIDVDGGGWGCEADRYIWQKIQEACRRLGDLGRDLENSALLQSIEALLLSRVDPFQARVVLDPELRRFSALHKARQRGICLIDTLRLERANRRQQPKLVCAAQHAELLGIALLESGQQHLAQIARFAAKLQGFLQHEGEPVVRARRKLPAQNGLDIQARGGSTYQ